MKHKLSWQLNHLWTNNHVDHTETASTRNPEVEYIWHLKKKMNEMGEVSYNEALENKVDTGRYFTTTFDKFIPVEDHDNWHQTGKSCYGASLIFLLEFIDREDTSSGWFIDIIFHICFTAFCLLPVLLVGWVQGVILYFLWDSRPQLDDPKSYFCQVNPVLLIAALIVFFSFTLPSLDDILEETFIVRHANLKFCYNKDNGCCEVRKVEFGTLGRFYSVFVVVWETMVWIGVLAVGTLYILTSANAGKIIEATVAVVFVNDIDNLAEYFYKHGKDITCFDIETTRFKANLIHKRTPVVRALELLLCNQVVGPIFISIISTIVVYAFRDHTNCDNAESTDFCDNQMN